MKQDPVQATFSHLLLSGTLVHEGSFEEMQESFGIRVHPQVVMVVSIDRYTDLVIGKPFHWSMEIGQQVVEGVCEAISEPFVWVWVAEGVLAVLVELALHSPKESGFRQVTGRIARQIQERCKKRGVNVSIGIGSYYDNPYQLHFSYEEAKEAMVDRFFQGNALIFHYEKKQGREAGWDSPLTPAERAELVARLRIGDEEGTVASLRALLDKMAQTYRHDVNMFKSEAVELVITMSRQVLDSGANAALILSENARFIQDLYVTIRYDKFVQKVCEYARRLTAYMEQNDLSDVSPIIRQAVRYLKENLRRKLTLEEVAQYCCVSVYHLSRLFKRETGMSPIDFLNRLRVEKAKYYLSSTDCTIQEIAAVVGFQDANYFTRTFKKYANCSPTAYRRAKLC
ncbi:MULTISPECIES: helix-turn-helix domain-containing protein [Brevibacillus]|jgi:two-component system, response regulator YesN|uniref:AraC family transcriptional regulator n=1 Tax=Brevibacillus aydinogluensis TaxID=927786 RepID=A0AA48MA78_9BACL|nr:MULTISPECIES: helix-turn-helix domain-containing protein [Brevibacillus]MDT3416400.1 two-component system response regulator YesN [Brevibacillus aydinogluensis]NNV02353.1 AraC family transcriptional regulator [Brevibacillus sp. MCWH]REK66869.1 MAG: AraC family transcriptional regulator [Brevibacillus sp.]CAJ1004146.1 AraC family transcriptional regulator [Brevibacillus aydinogluensis]